jgi:hypothetical protein
MLIITQLLFQQNVLVLLKAQDITICTFCLCILSPYMFQPTWAFKTVVLNSQFPLSRFGNYVNKRLQNRQLRKSCVSNCFGSSRLRIERALPGSLLKAEFDKL